MGNDISLNVFTCLKDLKGSGNVMGWGSYKERIIVLVVQLISCISECGCMKSSLLHHLADLYYCIGLGQSRFHYDRSRVGSL